MIWPRKRRADPSQRRRGGPVGEAHWWDDEDQALVQSELISEADIGPGWRRFPMLNNQEQLDPYGQGAVAEELREQRARRRLSALDEGMAWRRKSSSSLLVARFEMFEDANDHEHRESWRSLGPQVLEQTWRQRWQERDVTPGWIEAKWLDEEDLPDTDLGDAAPAVDWLRIEDHTRPVGGVTVYHHLSLWRQRLLATLTMRHDIGVEADPAVALAVAALWHRPLDVA